MLPLSQVIASAPRDSIIFSRIGRKDDGQDSEVVIPKTPFIHKLGYLRLNRYLYAIGALAVVMAAIVIISNYVEAFKSFIVPAIGIYIFLVLVGGAIYFTIISVKEGKRREMWSRESFEDSK